MKLILFTVYACFILFELFGLIVACKNPNSTYSNTYYFHNHHNENRAMNAEQIERLKVKRELSDGPTILMYIAIACILVIPQIPQIQ